jgi:integrase
MGAILDLTWDRVDFSARTIDFNPAGRDKSNKRRTVVPINERALAALKVAREGALTDNVIEYGAKPVASVKKAIAAAAQRSGIKCSPHDFRRSAARWMAEADVSMERIAQYLGHTSTASPTRPMPGFRPGTWPMQRALWTGRWYMCPSRTFRDTYVSRGKNGGFPWWAVQDSNL